MRRGTKIQITDRKHPLFLAKGEFIKNKLGRKAVVNINGHEIVILRSRFEQI